MALEEGAGIPVRNPDGSRQVQASMEALGQEIDALHDVVASLEKRLEPVLLPMAELAGDEGALAPEAVRAPIAGMLEHYRVRVAKASQGIRRLLDELQI